MKLSVSMIVKNEESCIEKCLQSIKGADEIIVCDTGSTDKTVEICQKYTNVYTDYTWNDSMCEARNHALSKVTGDWVLSIDADEYLEEGGIEKIRKAIDNAGNFQTVNITLVSTSHGDKHKFPRVFKKGVFWKGAIHNYLSVSEINNQDINIYYSYSEAHKKDPDRALRILNKEVIRDPNCVREKYYLAREYWYRKDFVNAIYWYEMYLKVAHWAPEWADAWLMLARCYLAIGQGDKAKDCCLQAIKINADFTEALLFMSELSGPKNKEKWLLFAEMSKNEDVLFARPIKEKGKEYYEGISKDTSRYENIYKKVGEKTVGKVLDIGCGQGRLSEFVNDYHGFDIIENKFGIKNAYEGNYEDADTYVLLEVLEHLDDKKILDFIPSGKKLIFSVPSFRDPSHIRIFTEDVLRWRYKDLINIDNITRFNWTGKWEEGGNLTTNYILLVEATKR